MRKAGAKPLQVQPSQPGNAVRAAGLAVIQQVAVQLAVPGAGKTILGNQVAFAAARDGKKVLYATLLAETHDRLFKSLSTLSFFDKDRLGSNIVYLSVFQTLKKDGLSAVVDSSHSSLPSYMLDVMSFIFWAPNGDDYQYVAENRFGCG